MMRQGWLRNLLLLLATVVVLGAIAVYMGPDGNYDLRNYHFYNGWALFHKPVGYDIAPAQVQTWNHPLLDGMFYGVWLLLNTFPLVFTFVWAIPQALAVWLAFLIARDHIFARSRFALPFALLATVIAAGGATSIGVIGTSMSEGIPNALLLFGMLLTIRDIESQRASWIRLGAAGLLVGSAIGLKLTTAPYGVGFVVALALTPSHGGLRQRINRLVAFGILSSIGLVLIAAPWWAALYRVYGNPLFPFYNGVFHSPDYGNWNWSDDRFLPRNLLDHLFYPWEWMVRKSRLVSEEPVRDLRIGLALLSAVVILITQLFSRPNYNRNSHSWCALFFLGTYYTWQSMFSILRYASGLEVISGILIIAALVRLERAWKKPAITVGAAGLVTSLILATTVFPTWERHKNAQTALLHVEMPQVPPQSLVIFLVAVPASYIIPFEPPSVRFIGVYNSIISLNADFGLQRRVEDAIRTQIGPIYGVEKTDSFPGMADKSLARYGLKRTNHCKPIESNQDYWLQICRLERTSKLSAASH